MKRILVSLVFVLYMAGAAGATVITLTDTTQFTATGTISSEDLLGYGRGEVYYLDGLLDYVSWNHQFTFDPPAEQILSATLTVYLRDDQQDPWYWQCELAFGYTESGSWDFGEVDTGDYTYGIDVSYLSDGVFQVKIVSVGGDFYIDKSVLTIDYTAVPEPATLLLLGSSLVGMAAFKRKLKK